MNTASQTTPEISGDTVDAVGPVAVDETSASSGSLRVRMLVSGGLVLVLFLGVMGAVLDNAFRLSAEEAESQRLLLHIYALIAASNEGDVTDANSLYLPKNSRNHILILPGLACLALCLTMKVRRSGAASRRLRSRLPPKRWQ